MTPRRSTAALAAPPLPAGLEEQALDVLVVDDDAAARALLRDQLADDRVRLRDVASAEAGLEVGRRDPPDLLLLALELPGLTGFEALVPWREHPATRGVPVVCVSERNDARTRAAAFAAGADCFLAKPYSVDELRAAVFSLGGRGRSLRDRDEAGRVLEALARILDLRVPGSRAHMQRVVRMARAFGVLLGFDAVQCLAMERAGWLHDVGKIALPARILNKPGPLTPAERRVMRRHPVVGERLCARLPSLAPVLPAIRHHHEHWDGGGYPDGLAGEAIPLLARAFQIVDVFDALVSRRAYKPAYTTDHALSILRDEARRGLWDPSLTAAFCAAVSEGLLPAPGDG